MTFLSQSFILRVTEPVSVYLTALVSILVTTCLKRISSPFIMDGISGSISSLKDSPLLRALDLIMVTRSFNTEANW